MTAAAHPGLQAQYEALRRHAGLLDLTARGKLRLGGADRGRFLNDLLTNDILVLRPGQGCNALKVTLQGKMEAALRILCFEDELWCDLDAEPLAALLRTLRMRILRAAVTVEDTSAAWALFSLQGPEAVAVLEKLGVSAGGLGELHRHAGTVLAGIEVHLVRSDHTGEGGYDVWVPEAAAGSLRAALLEAGAVPVGPEALEVRRIEAGIPRQGVEITTERFPQEAGLEAGWISYTKGCFFGQETIARLHHLGHVNRHLCGVCLDADSARSFGDAQLLDAANAGDAMPRPGSVLVVEGKEVGLVTSAVRSLGLGVPVALAYVRRDFAQPDTAVRIQVGAASLPGRIVTLPFL